MILLLWIAREVARHRQRERERLEPDGFSTALAWAVAAVLVVLGFAISWWLFWIGLFVLAPVVIALSHE